MSRAVWQLTGAKRSLLYADVFLRYGVALIGPGDAGRWRPERSDADFGGPFVRRFAAEVEVGDVFLLRTGKASICAVGIVASDYLYLEGFDDVMGWDLQHARRVRWYELPEEYTFENLVFGANPPRLSGVQNEDVLDYVNRFLSSEPTSWQKAALPELPPEEPLLEEPPSAIKDIVATAKDLMPLMLDSDAFGDYPSEDEMIVHLVVPFLRALGWPPECIGVKWRRVDIALFRSLPRTPENCSFVIEVKRLGTGVENALNQARAYVTELDAGPCDAVVTDGVRYRLYSGERGFEPIAYANLWRLKRSAVELFERMKR